MSTPNPQNAANPQYQPGHADGGGQGNTGISPDELLKQNVEMWKTTVGTQQHFNTLKLQLRNFGLSLYLAVLAAVVIAIKEHLETTLFGWKTSTAILACFAGAPIVLGFYLLDWGYHRLLKGSVDHGSAIEKVLKKSLPTAGLAEEISKASKARKVLWIFPTSSTRRLHMFYLMLLAGLAGAGFFAHRATASAAPAAPSRLGASAVSSSTVNVTWTDNANNETGFEIERGTDGTSFTRVGTTLNDITAYTDSGLAANTTYYYRVRAVNSAALSACTAVVNATTKALTTPIPTPNPLLPPAPTPPAAPLLPSPVPTPTPKTP